MIKLLFVVPYPDLKDKVSHVLSNHAESDKLKADVVVASVDAFENMRTKSYDAIIARGYTAIEAIDKYIHIPTIELAISSFDILRALREAKKKYDPKKVAFCGFYSVFSGSTEFSELFDMDISVYTPKNYKNLGNVIEKAKNDGAEIIIGGYSSNTVAREKGLKSVIIKSGEEAIHSAINEAIRAVELIRQEKIKSEMHYTITKIAKEGIIYADNNGKIIIHNKVASEMSGLGDLVNRQIKTAFPFLERNFRKSINENLEISGELYTLKNGMKINAVLSPVNVNDEVNGVVVNLNDITRLQDLEGQIRRKLSDKGLRAKYSFNDLIYESKIMVDVVEKSKRYAKTDSNIIIVGETGTGKELFAQSIHNYSNRKDGPFVAVNCAALPENLLESEFFGYVEGAFTGSNKGGKIGLFEQAHKGTIFLDEISEIPISLQSKLLRVLQEKEIRRIGDEKVTSIDVRVISATNKNLSKIVETGEFRKDLLYRLDVLRVFVPPLRRRDNDIISLFKHLVVKVNSKESKREPSFDKESLKLLYDYSFPGNIRELTNIAERVCVLSNELITKDVILEALYPEDIEFEDIGLSSRLSANNTNSEKDHIMKILESTNGNKSEAAKILGIDRSTLWRKLKKYGL